MNFLSSVKEEKCLAKRDYVFVGSGRMWYNIIVVRSDKSEVVGLGKFRLVELNK